MATTKLQLEDWLDDLCVRFIINLPEEDLSTVARICFQVEEAQWFYEDFIRPLDPTLPSMSLRSFCLRIFQHCPLLANFSIDHHMRAFEEFLVYKTRVPVRGAILLNEEMDSTILVKGWKKGANWSFPRGKINKDEDDLDCAIREVYEETGFDIREAGLVPKDRDVKFIQISMRDQQIRLYVFRNVPMDTNFQPKTRKEISKIQWYKLSELPAFRKKGNHNHDEGAATSNANKFYMVAPFLVPLKKWVVQQKKRDGRGNNNPHLAGQTAQEEVQTEDDMGNNTEAAPDPEVVAEAMETRETDLELRRLLQEQIQARTAQANPTNTDHNSGHALMALLQNGGRDVIEQQPPQPLSHTPRPVINQLPHTPAELTHSQPPQPRTLYHHQPQHTVPGPSQLPPPPFAIAPLVSQYQSQSQSQNRDQNPSLAAYGLMRGPQLLAHTAPNQGPNQGPNLFGLPNNPQQRRPPILIHPQPLPPQVQQSRLTRDILSTPNLPELRVNPQPPTSHGNMTVGNSSQGSAQIPVPVSMSALLPTASPRLTTEKMALLEAFKSRPMEPDERPTIGLTTAQRPNSGQTLASTPAWSNSTSSHVARGVSDQRDLSQSLPKGDLSAMIRNGAVTSSLQPVVPNEKQTALLDLFKKAPTSTSIAQATVNPSATHAIDAASSALTQRTENVDPRQPLVPDKKSAQVQGNGGSAQTISETNLSYSSVSILSRPKQGQFVASELPESKTPKPLSISHDLVAGPNSGHMPPVPSTLSQENNPAAALPPVHSVTQGAAVSHKQILPRTVPALQDGDARNPAPRVLQRRQEDSSRSEQKQSLLSLFSSPPESIPSLPSDDIIPLAAAGAPVSPPDGNQQKLMALLGKSNVLPAGDSVSASARRSPSVALRSPIDQNTQKLLSLFGKRV